MYRYFHTLRTASTITMSNSSETKRNKILKAAKELFGKQGYGTSMESISRLADVSKQTVYSHFKNKDVLFETCMKEKLEEYKSDTLIFDLNAPIDEMLFRFGKRFHQTLLEPGAQHTYRNAISQIDAHPEFAATYLELGPKETLNTLASYLDAKAKEGIINLDHSGSDTAIQLLLMLHGKAVYWLYLGEDIQESEEQQNSYLKNCVDMFLNHLRT